MAADQRDWHVPVEWKCKTCGHKSPARLVLRCSSCTYCGSPDVAPIQQDPKPLPEPSF